jgi:hypothetical protein
VAQTVKGWPDATAKDRQEGARLADIVKQHSAGVDGMAKVERALDVIGDTLSSLDATTKVASSVAAWAAGKVADVLRRPTWPGTPT